MPTSRRQGWLLRRPSGFPWFVFEGGFARAVSQRNSSGPGRNDIPGVHLVFPHPVHAAGGVIGQVSSLPPWLGRIIVGTFAVVKGAEHTSFLVGFLYTTRLALPADIAGSVGARSFASARLQRRGTRAGAAGIRGGIHVGFFVEQILLLSRHGRGPVDGLLFCCPLDMAELVPSPSPRMGSSLSRAIAAGMDWLMK